MAIVPYDQREGFIWLNGQLVPWGDARMHVLTHGLHYASAVFEGMRAYDGLIFKLTEHNQRLHDSAKILDFEIPYSVAEIDAAGVQVKDLDIGLLDFPCVVGDEVILLCWKLGENGITHWHNTTEGFAGRKPIDERIIRGQKKSN